MPETYISKVYKRPSKISKFEPHWTVRIIFKRKLLATKSFPFSDVGLRAAIMYRNDYLLDLRKSLSLYPLDTKVVNALDDWNKLIVGRYGV